MELDNLFLTEEIVCPVCEGKLMITIEECDENHEVVGWDNRVCPLCSGKGKVEVKTSFVEAMELYERRNK